MPIKKILVGLGNPGKQYAQTRHNAGFLFTDFVASQLGGDPSQFLPKKKWQAEVLEVEQTMIVKPQTFMNKSGQAVQAIRQFYNLDIEDCLVAFDDLDLELGKSKLQFGVGPKVHNGLTSVYQHLATENFWHLRLGIDTRGGDRTVPADQYVLQAMSVEEMNLLQKSFQEMWATLLHQGLLSS